VKKNRSSGGKTAPVDRERKILGILLLSLGLLVVFGMVRQKSGGSPETERFNRMVSEGLLGLFGFGAWLIPLLLLRIGWNRLFGGTLRSVGRAFLLAGALLLTFSLLVFSTGILPGDASETVGGVLGYALFHVMDRYFGALGSTLIGVTFLLVVLTALYDSSLPRVSLPKSPETLGKIVPFLGSRLRGYAVLLAGGGRRTLAWLQERALRAESYEDEAAFDEPAIREEADPRAAEDAGAAEAKEDEEEDGEAPATEVAEPLLFEPAEPVRAAEPLPKKKRGPRGEKEYLFPPITLLQDPSADEPTVDEAYLRDQSSRLEQALNHFGVRARVIEVHPGPVITRFELEPAPGVKVQQIANLSDDLALALRAKRIRIVAPIPGKGAVGVEIPNPSTRTVYLKEIITSTAYANRKSTLTVALGKDISGRPFCTSLEAMPHLLIAGATGAGKSVSIHCILTSLLYGASPEEVHLVLIDPKMLEMTVYNGIPHLLTPVVTDAKDAARVLRWAVFEMERRYKLLARVGVRNILDYNRDLAKLQSSREIEEEGLILEPLPYLVVVIDEFADLILTAPNEIEDPVARLAQMARAVGIHLVLATQRPSVTVITGVIKANFPSRIAFQVASKIDSRTILDANGAEKLLGKGDMLFVFSGRPELSRIHGAYITTEETSEIVTFLKEQGYQPRGRRTVLIEEEGGGVDDGAEIDLDDELFDEAARIVIRAEQGSVSLLQRRLRVGYSRAARIVDLLEDAGVVGPFEGSKAREVLVGEEWLQAREEARKAGAREGEE
jgi:S-DNA-T family DNA segregation ATPase FtsK/SpoIIIE